MRKALGIITIGLSVFFCQPATGTATWYVDDSISAPGDGTSWDTAFKTIQEGIDASSDGDTVIVAKGTYLENIHFHGKNIILTSTAPLDSAVVANTIIDGNQSGSVVTFSGTEDETCVLSGFTIRNGSANSGGGIHGGTEDGHTRATIRNNVITDNSATGRYGAGGGIYRCDGRIENNTIANNSSSLRGTNGGGLAGCHGTIQNNLIAGNHGGNGGGLGWCLGTVQNNSITGNSAHGGGGIWGCDGTIRNNLIAANQAEAGAGLSGCHGMIQGNTISDNSARDAGGGLVRCNGRIVNCIIWGNTAAEGAALHESAVPAYSCIEDWSGDGVGNTNRNPVFADGAGGDYHIGAGSPCIDTGTNGFFSAWPQHDLDQNCRLFGNRTDMGCYEYGSSADSDGDLLSDADELAAATDPDCEDTDGDGLRDGLEILRGSDPLQPTPSGTLRVPLEFATIQEALCVAMTGDEIIVAPGTYSENLQLLGTDVTLRSSDPGVADIVSSTILDGGGIGPVVSFAGNETEACVVSGFTIQNGLSSHGGGISGANSHATIRNNVITANRGIGEDCGAGLSQCQGTIHENTISWNSGAWSSGGLYDCDGEVTNNVICDNSGFWGGGFYGCDGLIRENTISRNSATYGGGLASCNAAIERNVVTGNWGRDGGGLRLCNGTIQNNIIARNSGESGSGLDFCDGLIESNTIYGNLARAGSALDSCSGTILNCIIWGNGGGSQIRQSSTPTYSCIEHWTGGGEGNVTHYPYFVDAAHGDYHLRSWSPCIDAGDPTSPFSEEPDPNGGRINMGAYGNTAEATSRSPDSDNDGLPDEWEVQSFGSLGGAAADDPDDDGMSNFHEYNRGFDPKTPGGLHVSAGVKRSGDGRTWTTAFKTVREAVFASITGDAIIVAEGTYQENIKLYGKNIVLRSTDPFDPLVVASTILDGNQAGSVVTFLGTEDETCILTGFTIRNGKAQTGGGIYGGNQDNQTHATIRNNIITGNAATYRGGGLCRCDGRIENNTILQNSATDHGGGLFDCAGLIEGNTITENSAKAGGGLASCHGLMRNNEVTGNRAVTSGGGLFFSLGVIESTLYAGNSAECGAALANCYGNIRNATIVANSATGHGGGLAHCNSGITNCIIWRNGAPAGPQLYDSFDPTFSCVQQWSGGGEGNITEHPRFAKGSYRLADESPCIDAGVNEDWMRDAVDLDGKPRVLLGSSSMTVDMGAYEFGSFRFRIAALVQNGNGQAALTWNSRLGDTYTVWSCLDLLIGDWIEETTILSEGGSTTWNDSDASAAQKFYRIEVK